MMSSRQPIVWTVEHWQWALLTNIRLARTCLSLTNSIAYLSGKSIWLSITTLSIMPSCRMTFSIMTLSIIRPTIMTFIIRAWNLSNFTEKFIKTFLLSDVIHAIPLSVILQRVIQLIVTAPLKCHVNCHVIHSGLNKHLSLFWPTSFSLNNPTKLFWPK